MPNGLIYPGHDACIFNHVENLSLLSVFEATMTILSNNIPAVYLPPRTKRGTTDGDLAVIPRGVETVSSCLPNLGSVGETASSKA